MAGMAVTFGVVLHVDRAPAAPAAMAPLVHVPVIEGKVIAESINPVLPIESRQQAQLTCPNRGHRQSLNSQLMMCAANGSFERPTPASCWTSLPSFFLNYSAK